MNLKLTITIIFFLIVSILKGQTSSYVNNELLIDSLEILYMSPCTSFTGKQFNRNVIKRDKNLIQLLNKLYFTPLDSNFNVNISVLGFTREKPVGNIETFENGNFSYYRTNGGNLSAFVEIETSKTKALNMRILIATNSKFFCNIGSTSFSQCYFDVAYFRQFLGEVMFPLKFARSRVELESRKTY